MEYESDFTQEQLVSATEASRSFSEMLNQVEQGQRFRIQRRGRDVGVLSPPPATRRLASECLELLRNRPPVTLDDRFGDDLLALVCEERRGADLWES